MTSTISVVRCGHSRDGLFTHGSTRSKKQCRYVWSRYYHDKLPNNPLPADLTNALAERQKRCRTY